jgi:hypothetical protein
MFTESDPLSFAFSCVQDNGKITIRIRIEIPDERAALMAGLKPRPRMHINVRKPKTLGVLRYTCFGEVSHIQRSNLPLEYQSELVISYNK